MREHTTRGPEPTSGRSWSPAPCTTCTSGHDERQASRASKSTHFAPTFQIYLRFLPFVVSQITRVRQNRTNKCLLLPLFALIQRPFDLDECRRTPESLEVICTGWYIASMQQMTPPPPPFGERQVPSTPIIFRTKNPEKSRLGLIGKNFGKNLWENVSGEKESPQSCGEGARC